MKLTSEGEIKVARGSIHLMKVDGRTEIHRIPAGNDLKDHEPRLCPCGPKVEFRQHAQYGPLWAHDHALLGAVPLAFSA